MNVNKENLKNSELLTTIETIRSNKNIKYISDEDIEVAFDMYENYCAHTMDPPGEIPYDHYKSDKTCSAHDIKNFTIDFFSGVYTENTLPLIFAPDRNIIDTLSIFFYKKMIDDHIPEAIEFSIQEISKGLNYKNKENIIAVFTLFDQFYTYCMYNTASDNTIYNIINEGNIMEYISMLQLNTFNFFKGRFTNNVLPIQSATTEDTLHIIKPILQKMLHDKILDATIRIIKDKRGNSVKVDDIRMLFNNLELEFSINENSEPIIPFDEYINIDGPCSARNIKMLTFNYFMGKYNKFVTLTNFTPNQDITPIIDLIYKTYNKSNNPNMTNAEVLDSTMEEVDGGSKKKRFFLN